MEKNTDKLNYQTSNLESLESPRYHSIKLKSKTNKNKFAVENVEFIMEESSQVSPRKHIIKHIYKEKDNALNAISKEINKKQNHKKIKNQKSSIIYPTQKKIYNVIKKYINGKPQKDKDKENININAYKKADPISYKNIQSSNKEKIMHKSQSNPTINKPQEMNMESNFMKLSKDANIYTSNAQYIQNKKVLLFDKFNYDNNEYIPDRAKLFDMTRMPKIAKKDSFVFKTTKFRVGHFINKKDNNVYDSGIKNEFSNRSLLDFNYRNVDINKNNLSYNEYNSQTSLIRNPEKLTTQNSYIDNSYQKFKRHPPSDTFYKELMSKKNETYEQYFKSPNKEKEKEKEKEINIEEYADSNLINVDVNDKEMQGFLQPYYKNKTIKKKPEVKRLYYKQMLKSNKNELNGYSVLLSKKKNNMGQPLYFPKIFSSNINFDNYSQKERFEKISESFAGLKNLIENFKKKGELDELDFIYDYALSKNIDKNILTIKNLNNFYNFLHEKQMPLDSKKSLKENIILALNYDANLNNYEEKNKKLKLKLNNKDKVSNRIFIEAKSVKNKKKINDRKEVKLMLDLNLQKRVSTKDSFSVDNKINTRDELKKEIENIKNEVLNKQKIIENVRNINDKTKNYEKVFDSNERLYYTWFKNQQAKDINNYRKKSKLTELYYYNKTKEEIIKNDMEQKYFGEEHK